MITGAVKAQMKLVSYLNQHLKREEGGRKEREREERGRCYSKYWVDEGACTNSRSFIAIVWCFAYEKSKRNGHSHVQQW